MLFFALAFIAASCEHIIEFDSDISAPKITVNAIATPGVPFVAGIAKELFFTDAPYEPISVSLYDFFVLDNAEASIAVNGKEHYPLHFNPANLSYESGYTPLEGDVIVLQANASGFEPVAARTIVPREGELTILATEVLYSKNEIIHEDWSEHAADTIMRITVKIADPPNEKNYYRMKVRSIGAQDGPNEGAIYYHMSDIFSSADVIFQDERLVKRYRGWPAGFSNVFDDHLFNGKEYELTVETRMRLGKDQHVVVELQSITRELYNYLKSVMLYRITDQDAYTESIQVYSNVENGYGVLGALNSEKHVVKFR